MEQEYQSPSTKNQGKKPCNSACGNYARPGYYGLYNLGATCYLNAVLQTLFMTKQFREAVERRESLKTRTFEDHLKKLFQKLKKGTAVVEHDLLRILGITNKYEQDAAECFQKIVSLCNFTRIYHGQLKNSTKCLKHGHESEPEYSSFVILPLAIESHQSYSVMDGWKQFFKPSVLDGDNQLYCDVCDEKTDTEAVCELVSHPEVLTLQLKRFYFDYNYMMYMKNNCKVEIPLQLQDSQELYKLYAIIEHRGSVKSGHYYTIIKSFQDGNWYRFDDSRVTQVSHKIKDQNTITSEHAYMLLYTRRDTDSAESCTNVRSKVCGQSNCKNKSQGENDVARGFQKVDGHNRGPKESVHVGDWHTYGHGAAGDAGRKSHGEERVRHVCPSTHLLPQAACRIQGHGEPGAHPRPCGSKVGNNPGLGANPCKYDPFRETGNSNHDPGSIGDERSIITYKPYKHDKRAVKSFTATGNTARGKGAEKDYANVTRDKRDKCSPERNDDREENRSRTTCLNLEKLWSFIRRITCCQ